MNGDGNTPGEFTFTDEEIREQLEALGFENVSDEQLRIFKIELERLVEQERDAATDRLAQQSDESYFDAGIRLNDADDLRMRKLDVAQDEFAEPIAVRKHGHVLVEKLRPANRVYRSQAPSTASTSDDEVGNVRLGSLTPADSTSSGRSSASEMASTNSCYQPSDSCSRKESLSECSSTAGTRVRKRKVLRKLKHGTSVVCDETASQSSDTSSCYRELRRPTKSSFCPAVERNLVKSAFTTHSGSERPGSFPSSEQTVKKWRSTSDLGREDHAVYKSKSVILPYCNQKQARNYFKMDPVALYHYYKKEWATHNIPGEKDHRQLRWNIRTMMSTRDDVGLSRAQSRSSFLSM